jgi:hypothetical protein
MRTRPAARSSTVPTATPTIAASGKELEDDEEEVEVMFAWRVVLVLTVDDAVEVSRIVVRGAVLTIIGAVAVETPLMVVMVEVVGKVVEVRVVEAIVEEVETVVVVDGVDDALIVVELVLVELVVERVVERVVVVVVFNVEQMGADDAKAIMSQQLVP